MRGTAAPTKGDGARTGDSATETPVLFLSTLASSQTLHICDDTYRFRAAVEFGARARFFASVPSLDPPRPEAPVPLVVRSMAAPSTGAGRSTLRRLVWAPWLASPVARDLLPCPLRPRVSSISESACVRRCRRARTASRRASLRDAASASCNACARSLLDAASRRGRSFAGGLAVLRLEYAQ